MNLKNLEYSKSTHRTKKGHVLVPINDAVKLNLKVFNLVLLYLSFALGMGVLYNVFADSYSVAIFVIFAIIAAFFTLVFYILKMDRMIKETCENLLSKEWNACIFIRGIKDRKTGINITFTSFMVSFYFTTLIAPYFPNYIFSSVLFVFFCVLSMLIIYTATKISGVSLHRYLDVDVNTVCEHLRKKAGNKLKIRNCKKTHKTCYVKFDGTTLVLLIRKKHSENQVWLTMLNVTNKNVHLAYVLSRIIEESAGRGI